MTPGVDQSNHIDGITLRALATTFSTLCNLSVREESRWSFAAALLGRSITPVDRSADPRAPPAKPQSNRLRYFETHRSCLRFGPVGPSRFAGSAEVIVGTYGVPRRIFLLPFHDQSTQLRASKALCALTGWPDLLAKRQPYLDR